MSEFPWPALVWKFCFGEIIVVGKLENISNQAGKSKKPLCFWYGFSMVCWRQIIETTQEIQQCVA